jgi:hypothetical protein
VSQRDDRLRALEEKTEAWLGILRRPATQIVFVTSEANKDERIKFQKRWEPWLKQGDLIYFKPALSYGGVTRDDYMSRAPCALPLARDRITVAWDGTVTPCNLDVNCALAVGRMEMAEDLTEILEGAELQERLMQIERREGICANCFDANYTGGHRVVRGR